MLTQKLLVGEVQHAQRKKSSAAFKIIFFKSKEDLLLFFTGSKNQGFQHLSL